MDFGIAYRPDSGEVPTPPGRSSGLRPTWPPNRPGGARPRSCRPATSTAWASCCIELLCGQPPFFGPASSVLLHTIHHEPPPLRALAPKVPRALAAICRKALAEAVPSDRYLSCQALGDDLRRWLRGESPLAHRRRWTGLIR